MRCFIYCLSRYDNREPEVCQCSQHIGAIGRIVDGVDAVRKAVREEMRSGAHQIKIMASGGVGSPTDPIGNLQFSIDEIKAIVETAESHQTYVMAHAYTAKAIERIVRLGVRTIEHGNLVDDTAAAVMAEYGAYVVPTLVIYDAMSKVGKEVGVPDAALVKNEVVRLQGLEALKILKKHGVKMGLGTDLLGEMHKYQSDELRIRAEVLGNAETLCQATLIGAEIINMQGKLGVVAENAIADLLILEENPLQNIQILSGQGEGILGIIKDGHWEKNTLN
ncbi:amidohydrolase family protein [Rouxiella sp. WC2420]